MEQPIYPHLRQSRYFEHVSDEALHKFLALAGFAKFKAGETILPQGESNHIVYIIVSGVASVKVDGKFIYNLRRKGDVFGEMGVITGKVSSASIEAEEDMEVVTISAKLLETIQDDFSHELHHIFYKWFSAVLSEKVTRTSQKAKLYEDLSVELHQQKDQLEVSNRELKHLNHQMNEFLAIASHDLRSPLNGILMSIDALLTYYEGEEEAKELLRSMEGICTEQLEFVNAFLDIAKIESGKLHLEYTLLSAEVLREHLQTVQRNFGMQAHNKKITISLQMDEFLPEIAFDVPKVKQVINNLLSNALKFTPEGGKIRMNVQQKEEELQITLEDSGIGIPASELKKIFDMYQQVKERNVGTEGERGTGLGLAICKNIVELHGGRIWVESEPNQGSQFHFTLPLQPQNQ